MKGSKSDLHRLNQGQKVIQQTLTYKSLFGKKQRVFFVKLNCIIKSAVSHQFYTKTSSVTAACIGNVLKVHFTPFRGVFHTLLAIIQHFKQ